MSATTDIPTELLSLLYATVTDRSKWQAFCDSLHHYTSERILLFGHNIAHNDSLGIIAGGVEQDRLDVYHEYYADKNPWMRMNSVMPAGMVGISDQALDRADLFKTEFYNDWLKPQEDIVGGPAMICYRSHDRFVAMAAACRAKRIDDSLFEAHGLFERLSPHMANATSMAATLSKDGRTTFAHLDASRHGIIIIRRSGQIGYFNRSAEALLDSTPLIYINGGDRLGAMSDELKHFLRSSERAMAENRIEETGTPYVLSGRSFGPYVIHRHIFPAAADHRFPCSAWSDPVAGAFVITGPSGLGEETSYEQLASTFGATPAEARLAAAIMTGQSLNEYAEANTLSPHTVRNQMRALLQKTGTRNQADFIRRLAGFRSPFTVFT